MLRRVTQYAESAILTPEAPVTRILPDVTTGIERGDSMRMRMREGEV